MESGGCRGRHFNKYSKVKSILESQRPCYHLSKQVEALPVILSVATENSCCY
jgi:hypothetical protein